MPSCTRAKRSGSELEFSCLSRTWMWTRAAPASKAAWVDSICSDVEIGTAGLSFFRGMEPVMATVMMQGAGIRLSLRALDAEEVQSVVGGDQENEQADEHERRGRQETGLHRLTRAALEPDHGSGETEAPDQHSARDPKIHQKSRTQRRVDRSEGR